MAALRFCFHAGIGGPARGPRRAQPGMLHIGAQDLRLCESNGCVSAVSVVRNRFLREDKNEIP